MDQGTKTLKILFILIIATMFWGCVGVRVNVENKTNKIVDIYNVARHCGKVGPYKVQNMRIMRAESGSPEYRILVVGTAESTIVFSWGISENQTKLNNGKIEIWDQRDSAINAIELWIKNMFYTPEWCKQDSLAVVYCYFKHFGARLDKSSWEKFYKEGELKGETKNTYEAYLSGKKKWNDFINYCCKRRDYLLEKATKWRMKDAVNYNYDWW